MIAKKNKKANLEKKRFAFFQIGLLVSGSLCLAAFEWSSATPDERVEVYEEQTDLLALDIPQDIEEFTIVKEKQAPAMVNLDNVQNVTVVNHLTQQGNVQTTNNNDVIFIPGDDCIDCDFDWSITDDGEGDILEVAEIEPSFPGGEAAMMQWMADNIEYPSLPAEMGIGGVQYIQFVVNTDGSIVQVKTLQSTHDDLASEGIRVIKDMPKWTPGEQAGKKVRVRYTLPINFVTK